MSILNILCRNLWTLIFAFIVVFFSKISQGQEQQQESFVNCNENVLIEPISIEYGSHTVDCEISPETDLDRFVFTGSADDVVRIIVLSTTGNFDPQVEIRDPIGDLVAADPSSCNGGFSGGRCSFSTDVVLSMDGNYQVALSDISTNEPGSYTLQIEQLIFPRNAAAIFYDFTANDEINPPTDLDFFTFEGVQGTEVRLSILSETGNFDPQIDLWNPSGDLLSIDPRSCNGGFSGGRCSFQVDIALPENGAYRLALSDISNNEPGSYQISLQCLFGPCPTGQPNSIYNDDFELSGL